MEHRHLSFLTPLRENNPLPTKAAFAGGSALHLIVPLLFIAGIFFVGYWQKKRRQDFLSLLENHPNGLKSKFERRVFWNGFYGKFNVDDRSIREKYMQYQKEIALVRLSSVLAFMSITIILTSCF